MSFTSLIQLMGHSNICSIFKCSAAAAAVEYSGAII